MTKLKTPKRSPKQPRIRYPVLLVLEEHQGPVYFHIAEEKTLYATALAVLAARLAAGFYDGTAIGLPPPAPAYTDRKEIAKLRGDIKDLATQKLDVWESIMAKRLADINVRGSARLAVQASNGAAAWAILRGRKNVEYEGVELVAYETPKTYLA